MKRAVVAFNIEQVHLGKDVFLFPYYICKKYGYALDVITVATENNANLPETYHGARIIRIPNPRNLNPEIILSNYIKNHAKDYDFLILLHYRMITVLRCRAYKRKNPAGLVYVKLDMGIGTWNTINNVKGIKKIIKDWQLKVFEKYIDIYSVESSAIYSNILEKWNKKLTSPKVFELVPNGFDEEELENTGIKVKPYDEKKNFLITVGRAGSYQKNTEFLLCFLDKLDFKGWKVKIIGPYTQEIYAQYEALCKKNPAFADAVEFTGNITDKATLFSYYNEAKIFCLPSRWEAFALVLTEAMRFGNYIITSPIISANDLTDSGRTGSILPLEEDLWVKEIQSLIDDDSKLKAVYSKTVELSEKKFRMAQIIENAKIFKCLKDGHE